MHKEKEIPAMNFARKIYSIYSHKLEEKIIYIMQFIFYAHSQNLLPKYCFNRSGVPIFKGIFAKAKRRIIQKHQKAYKGQKIATEKWQTGNKLKVTAIGDFTLLIS